MIERRQITSPATGAQPIQPIYLRRQQAARYLSCCLRTLDQLKHDGRLPYHCLSRRLIVFSQRDLDALMSRHRIDVVNDPPAAKG